MQTKKKASRRNGSRECVSPRASRAQKKVSENGQVVEKKVVDLITSSARKIKPACAFENKAGEPVPLTLLDNEYDTVDKGISCTNLGNEANDGASVDFEGCNKQALPLETGTIFSPGFHLSKGSGGKVADRVDFVQIFRCDDQKRISLDQEVTQLPQEDAVDGHVSQDFDSAMEVDINNSSNVLAISTKTVNGCSSDFDGNGLSMEVPSIYLAMKNSKLECIDEHGQDSVSSDMCPEDDEFEDFDDFDPYLFIKTLPDLSRVVPTFRRMLLPKQTRSCPPITLVLDLDETLVHSTLEPCEDIDFTFTVNFNCEEHNVYVRCRPHLKDFLERVSGLFEPIPGPETGCVLVATEKLDGVRTFERTVVLLLRSGTRQSQEGPFGIVINRPLHKKIKNIRPTNQDLTTSFSDCSLHFGGPLEASMFLLKSGEKLKVPGFEEVVPGLYFGARNSLDDASRLVKKGIIKPRDFSFFIGYAGWQIDQLRDEIESEYWHVAACSSSLLYEAMTDSSEGMWEEILQLMGGDYSELSQKPKQEDP